MEYLFGGLGYLNFVGERKYIEVFQQALLVHVLAEGLSRCHPGVGYQPDAEPHVFDVPKHRLSIRVRDRRMDPERVGARTWTVGSRLDSGVNPMFEPPIARLDATPYEGLPDA